MRWMLSKETLMKITTNHPQSSYGIPVILSRVGEVMDYAGGLCAVMERLNISPAELATACGVSVATVYNWRSGNRRLTTEALNVLRDRLEGVK